MSIQSVHSRMSAISHMPGIIRAQMNDHELVPLVSVERKGHRTGARPHHTPENQVKGSIWTRRGLGRLGETPEGTWDGWYDQGKALMCSVSDRDRTNHR